VLMRPAFDACTSCHEDAHGGQLARWDDKGRCDACHTPHGWKPSRFTITDHERTRFALEGAHREAACSACHGPRRPGLPDLPGPDVLGPARVAFHVEGERCEACHVDPHEGRYAPGGRRAGLGGCLRCHGFERFRPAGVTVEAHADFGFALEGAHRATPCFLCHGPMKGRPKSRSTLLLASRVEPLPLAGDRRACRDCHESPHGRQFDARADGGRCDACHGVERFRPAIRFDHDRDTNYPLVGAHAQVACAKCHPAVRGADGRPMTRYRPIPTACSYCHGSRALAPLTARAQGRDR